MDEDQSITNGWHLRKEVSLSHLLTTVIVIAAIMKFGYDMDKRVTVLEANQSHSTRSITEIKETVRRVDSKIDRLIERG